MTRETMNYLMQQRPNYIDYARVFMIYLVVLGHYSYAIGLDFLPSPVWSLMKMITLFHIPFFFIVSGSLYKAIPVKETIKKGWIQLMRPYFIMCVTSCVIMVFVDLFSVRFSFRQSAYLGIGVFTGSDCKYGISNWSSPLWFCYALFIVKIAVSFMQITRNRMWFLGEALLLIILSIVVLYKGNIFSFRLDSSLVGMFFFSVGYFMKDFFKNMIQSSYLIRVTILILSLFCLIVCGCFNLNFEIKQGLSINACYFGEHPLLFLISGLSGSVAVLILASFVSLKSQKPKNIVMQISNGTIIILGFHWVIYKTFFSWWLTSYNVVTALFVAFVNLIVCYIFILLANKYCPILLGNRKIS